MSEPTLNITISPNGQVTSEVKGVAGPGCEQLQQWLAELGDVTVDRRTPDYYQRVEQSPRARIGQSSGGRR